MSDAITPDKTVDAIGSACPGPLMDLIGEVKSMDTGEIVELQTGDEGSKNDVPEWVDEAGHDHLDTVDNGDYYSIYVELT